MTGTIIMIVVIAAVLAVAVTAVLATRYRRRQMAAGDAARRDAERSLAAKNLIPNPGASGRGYVSNPQPGVQRSTGAPRRPDPARVAPDAVWVDNPANPTNPLFGGWNSGGASNTLDGPASHGAHAGGSIGHSGGHSSHDGGGYSGGSDSGGSSSGGSDGGSW